MNVNDIMNEEDDEEIKDNDGEEDFDFSES